MEKNWLIRTKNNHILGPVSKEKVRELIQNGSIKGEDEVCSGNGYWLFIREKDLVDRFILGDEPQGFNPVAEADTVLAYGADQESQLPSDENLEYPQLEEQDDITMVGGIDISDLQDLNLSEQTDPAISVSEEESLPPIVENQVQDQDDLSKDDTQVDFNVTEISEKIEVKKESNSKKNSKSNKNGKAKKKQVSQKIVNDKTLYLILFTCLLLALSAFYFRKRILKTFIGLNNISIIPTAHAQIKDGIVSKKKD